MKTFELKAVDETREDTEYTVEISIDGQHVESISGFDKWQDALDNLLGACDSDENNKITLPRMVVLQMDLYRLAFDTEFTHRQSKSRDD